MVAEKVEAASGPSRRPCRGHWRRRAASSCWMYHDWRAITCREIQLLMLYRMYSSIAKIQDAIVNPEVARNSYPVKTAQKCFFSCRVFPCFVEICQAAPRLCDSMGVVLPRAPTTRLSCPPCLPFSWSCPSSSLARMPALLEVRFVFLLVLLTLLCSSSSLSVS